jgi:hypothetical protein
VVCPRAINDATSTAPHVNSHWAVRAVDTKLVNGNRFMDAQQQKWARSTASRIHPDSLSGSPTDALHGELIRHRSAKDSVSAGVFRAKSQYRGAR